MAITKYVFYGLTGGAAGDLDEEDGDNLLDGDVASVYVSGSVYHYKLDATSTEAVSSPSVIPPATNPGTKQWLLQAINFLDSDVDFNGYYALQLQNIPDLAAKGRGYWFDGVDDYINLDLAAAALVDTGNQTGVVVFEGVFHDLSTNNDKIWYFGDTNANERLGMYVPTTDNKLAFICVDAGTTQWTFEIDDTLSENVHYSVVLVQDGTAPFAYINGKLVDITFSTSTDTTAWFDQTTGIDNGRIGDASYNSGGEDDHSKVTVNDFAAYNLELTAAEVKALSSGAPVPYKYIGASQTDLISGSNCAQGSNPYTTFANETPTAFDATSNGAGNQWATSGLTTTFVIGKHYRIEFDLVLNSGTAPQIDIVSAADATRMIAESRQLSVNGSNSMDFAITAATDTTAGVAFINLTTATDYEVTNLSITQIGCVLQLEQDGMTNVVWGDKSGNNLDGTVSGAILINDSPAEAKPVLTNLLTNTEWKASSNSTLLEVTSGAAPVLDGANAALVNNLLSNGGFDSVTTGWTAGGSAALTSDAGGKTGNMLTITENTGDNPYAYQQATVVIGKLYQLNIYCKAGTEATYDVRLGHSGPISVEYLNTGGEAAADWTTTVISHVFKATSVNAFVSLRQTAASGSGTTLLFDSVTLYEVVPGFVDNGNNLCFDGWYKDSTLDVWRQHNDGGTLTKDGSFYAVKTTSGGVNDFMLWPLVGIDTAAFHYQRFAGRTVALGVWAKTSTASHVRIGIYDGSHHYSSYHTGGGGWEWIEMAWTVSAAASGFEAVIWFDVNATDAYISQPMLVYGSSIGEGNYQPRPGEIVWFEDQSWALTDYSNATISDTDDETISIEAQSDGKIGKGVAAIQFYVSGADSNVGANTDVAISQATGEQGLHMNMVVDNIYGFATGWVKCDANGDVYFTSRASGGDTLSGLYVQPLAIQLR